MKTKGKLKIVGLILAITAIVARLYIGSPIAAIVLVLICSIVGIVLVMNKRVQVVSINVDSIDLTQFFIGTFTIWAEEITTIEKKMRTDGPFYEVGVRNKIYRLDNVDNEQEIENFINRNQLKEQNSK